MPKVRKKRFGGPHQSNSAHAACRKLAGTLDDTKSRRVLLLQGPVGPFFKRLQRDLEQNGFAAWHVAFHRADQFFAAPQNTLHFGGDIDEWLPWLKEVLRFGGFDAIVLFGSERPAHRIARELACAAGIDVISLEEGYIRPGYITVENQGNNASSPLAAQINHTASSGSPPIADVKSVNSLPRMITYGALYYTLRGAMTPRAARHMFHRETPLVSEAFYWARNFARRVVRGSRDFGIIQSLLEHFDGQFYLVPLQVGADANMLRFSNGWNSTQLITASIQSFAQTAPAGNRLFFKVHTMERGHNNLTPLIRRIAAENRVSERVDVIETGSLGLLTRHSAGMITINSTSAFSAIFHGVPLMVLGRAIYAHPSLATLGAAFDSFWTTTHVASPSVRADYIKWIKEETLKPGDFYADAGIDVAVRGITEKLKSSTEQKTQQIILKAAS